MTRFLLIAMTLFSVCANANVSDVMTCQNADWTISVGLNSVPVNSDTVLVLVEGAEGGEGLYKADIDKNTLFNSLEEGLKLDDPANNDKNVALLTLEGNNAKLVSGAGLQILSCTIF